MTASELLAIAAGATPGHRAPVPPPQFGEHPAAGMRERMRLEQREAEESGDGCGAGHPRQDHWWAVNTNRSASRGSKARPIPKAGRVRVADAVQMLVALGAKRSAKMVERGGWWRARAQAVLAVAAGLAVTGQTEKVLGGDRRCWFAVLCSLPVATVAALRLPAVAERALRRWLRVRVYSALPWVAQLGSLVASPSARRQLCQSCARESWRVTGRAVRPKPLLRWTGKCPERFEPRRRRIAWAG
jgi:hypothetical protein